MKLHTAKIAAAVMLLLILCFTAAINYACSSADSVIPNLIPQKLPKNLVSTLLADQPEAVPASADGDFSDLLLPNAEKPPETEYQPDESDPPKRILLYHTHTTEAYRPDGTDTYEASGDYRTHDNSRNIVAIGALMKEELEKLGYEVIHDTTDNEPPKLATAYSRSLKTMEKYENIDVYIDIHRDASGSANLNDVVQIDGKQCARMMFVVGKDLKSNGEPYDSRPNFENTYALAQAITDELNGYHENFMREVRIKNGRYNQHLSPNSLLIEVGHNMNTLQEAKNSVRYFAEALHYVLNA